MNLIKVVIYIALMLIVPFSTFSASENKSITDLQYSLTANTNQVLEGYEVQFNFEYQALAPITDIESLMSESITIDFSNLVDDGNDIEYTLDSDSIGINISSTGIVEVSFKNLSSNSGTLTEFGGNIVFTVTAKNVEEVEDVIVTDSVGNEVIVTINVDDPESPLNTNKASVGDFVRVGDTVDYMLMINGNYNTVDMFHGIDVHSSGMEYVDGSFYAEEDYTWNDMSDGFVQSYDSDGNLIIDSIKPFDTRVLLHYQMTITDEYEVYKNDFEADYGFLVENAHDDVWYDNDSESTIDYTHGNIEITKVDEKDNPLSGAEFDIIDSEGNTIDHVVTDNSGIATSVDLPLGDYKVAETLAPVGYQIDNNEYPISLTDDKSTEPIVGYVTSISSKQPVDPEDDIGGSISIHLQSEDGTPIGGASFGVYDEDGNLLEVITTDSNGNATSQLLGPGRYYIQQQNSVNGYVLDSTKYWFTIGNETITTEYNVVNQQIEGTVQMYNSDNSGNGLSQSTFNLYDEQNQLVTSITTNEYGYGRRVSLPYGSYYIQQTSVTAGYQLNPAKFSFSITENNQQVNLSCINYLVETEVNNAEQPELDYYQQSSINQAVTDSKDIQQIDETEQYLLAETGSNLQAVLVVLSVFLATVCKFKLVLKNRDI